MGAKGISKAAPLGKRFGRLTVIGPPVQYKASSSPAVLCRCDCGDERHYFSANLKKQAEPMCPPCREANRPSKGQHKHPLFNIWKAMIQRCENPNHDAYDAYGGRGISICARWRQDFLAFAADVGERPSAVHTIDRIDTNGDYEPGNVRWAKKREQSNNRRDNHRVEWQGRSLTIAEAAREAGISTELLLWRLAQGWVLERAMAQPKRRDRRTSCGAIRS